MVLLWGLRSGGCSTCKHMHIHGSRIILSLGHRKDLLVDKQEDSLCTFSTAPRLSATPGVCGYLPAKLVSEGFEAGNLRLASRSQSQLSIFCYHKDKHSSSGGMENEMTCIRGQTRDGISWSNAVHYDTFVFIITVNRCNQQVLIWGFFWLFWVLTRHLQTHHWSQKPSEENRWMLSG